MNDQKTFKIGELSSLYDIGVDSIRYYEKVGLLHPLRDPENNYRLYTVDDVRKLTMIRELLNLNFSTDQIRAFYGNRSISHTQALLEQELSVVNQSIADMHQKRDSIEARLNALKQNLALKELEQVKVITLPERNCLMVSDSNLPDDYVDYYLVKYMHSQQKKVDTIGACDCYTLDIHNSNPKSNYLRTKNVFFYSDTLHYHTNYTLPAGDYLTLSYRGSLTKTKQLLPRLYEYATRHHFTVIGDPMEFCHIDDYETAIEEEYLTELQLAVERPANAPV